MKFTQLYISAILVAFLCSFCQKKQEPHAVKFYTGPMVVTKQLNAFYSDSAKIKLQVIAPIRSEYRSGDQEYAKGIRVNFFNDKQQSYAYLQSNYAQYDKETDIFLAIGNVIVENTEEAKKLETEELRWNRQAQKIYTDKFVRITTPKEVISGMGLEASQDFTYYKIKKVQGTTILE